jgi:hypothetical protein
MPVSMTEDDLGQPVALRAEVCGLRRRTVLRVRKTWPPRALWPAQLGPLDLAMGSCISDPAVSR